MVQYNYVNSNDTAVVFIDPQNDVLSEKGLSWELVGASVTENHTVEHMEYIFQSAKAGGFRYSSRHIIFIQPIVGGN